MRLAAVGLLTLTALGLSACKKAPDGTNGTVAAETPESDAGSSSKVSLPVVGAEVRRGDLILSINTTGQVRSQAVANLTSETSGTVARVLVQPGARVTRGQPLVMLDPRPFDLAVQEAEASVAEATVR